ncbi:hypothetical protein LTR84_002159 [Exophiala bonariae]|uniref:Methyltransferase domain-containing protein n=1 Tax=Exophiala bonariae TaxID=1690606 RepID=A0AAV9NE43_9EURO|nr:hypothetical protein LTR84_002159 [Exophiala bonariae]
MDEASATIYPGEEQDSNCAQDNQWLLSIPQLLPEGVPSQSFFDSRSADHLPDLDDEGYSDGASSPTPSSTTISSTVHEGVWENNRCYPSYGRHEYGLPIDTEEQKRMVLQHEKHKLLLGKPYLAPLGSTPQKILDLATGTGLWPIEVADQTPSAQVIGVDIAPIAPLLVPPNCSFEIDDIERTWSWSKSSFDLIHIREPLYCIRDWDRLFNQIYTHLKPGGWVEIACTYMRPIRRGGKSAITSEFTRMCDQLMSASEILGTSSRFPPQLTKNLRNRGFVNVVENVFETPTTPYATTDLDQKIGLLEMLNLDMGTPSIGLRIMERAFGWSEAETEMRMQSFKKSSRMLRRGAYFQ